MPTYQPGNADPAGHTLPTPRQPSRQFVRILVDLLPGAVALLLILLVTNNALLVFAGAAALLLYNAYRSSAAAAFDDARTAAHLKRQINQTKHLLNIARTAASTLNIDNIGQEVAPILRDMLPVQWVMMTLLDQSGSRAQVLAVSHNGTNPQTPEMLDLNIHGTMPYTLRRSAADLPSSIAEMMDNYRLEWVTVVPMIAYNVPLGAILLGDTNAHTLDLIALDLLQNVADQVAANIHNIRLYNDTFRALNRQLDQITFIEDIVQKISSSHDLNQIINDVLEAALRTSGADLASLALPTETGDFWVIARTHQDGVTFKDYYNQQQDEGLIGHVAQTNEMAVVSDNRTDQYYMARPEGYLSSMVVPLEKDGQVAGVLNLESRQLDYFKKDGVGFLTNLGAHAMISIDNTRLVSQLQQQINTLTSLRELALELSSAVDVSSVANALLTKALNLMNSQFAAIFRLEEGADNHLTTLAILPDLPGKHQHLALMRDVVMQAAQLGEIQTTLIDQPADSTADTNGTYASLVAVPIKRTNAVREVLCLAFDQSQTFQQRDLNILDLLATQAAGHLENATLHEQIQKGHDQIRAILDAARDGLILLDSKGGLAEVNPSAQRLLGINLGDYLGENFVTLLLKRTEVTEQAQAGYSREEVTNMARLLRLEPERITKRDFAHTVGKNKAVHIEEIGSPVMDKHNNIVGRLLVLRDVTEEKQLAAYREEITGMAVHDLRGPLASIINAVKIAQENLETPINENIQGANQALAITLESADKLLVLVNSILDINKLEKREMKLESMTVAASLLLESAHQALAPSIQKAKIQVEIRVADKLPLLSIDYDKVRRVVINLLDNALRFTPSGGKVLLSAELQKKDKWVIIRIADSGPGIPVDEREHVFEKYRQIKGNTPLRGGKGSGIGLTFCKLVVEAHGGHIWVEQESPLSGACFAFTLPVDKTL